MPVPAKASFFDSLFGNDASASIVDSINSAQAAKNSQTIDLLQTDDVSSLSTLNDKKNKDSKTKDTDISSDDDINIVSENSLLPETSHVSVSGENDNGDSYSDQISVYVIRKGDSISQIAGMFDVSVNTILVANNLKKGAKLVEGDVLFILPVSGIEHKITKGQTLKSIAKIYKIDASDIAQFNGITDDSPLVVGDKLMIPGGDMLDEGGDKPAANLGGAAAKDKNYYASHPAKSLLGFFINPVPTGRKTQGLHGPGHRGIDIGAPMGTPIYAAAGGTVILANIGWSGGYGNMAIIQHANGTKTLYGHMSKIATHTGDKVSQGEIIGYVGSTGHSTGPHLHFEVFNAKNPGSDWSWKN